MADVYDRKLINSVLARLKTDKETFGGTYLLGKFVITEEEYEALKGY